MPDNVGIYRSYAEEMNVQILTLKKMESLELVKGDKINIEINPTTGKATYKKRGWLGMQILCEQ